MDAAGFDALTKRLRQPLDRRTLGAWVLASAAGAALDRRGASAHASESGAHSLVLTDAAGALHPYEVSIDWSPVLVNLPDGDAWAFFTAQLNLAADTGSGSMLDNRQVFAARFDSLSGVWQPGAPLSDHLSFGVTATLDGEHRLHTVFSARDSLELSAMSTLLHLALLDDGSWSTPQPIDLFENAGHQLSPDLTTDADGQLHLVWQDQRSVTPAMRADDPSNADVFASDFGLDGVWSAPVQINQRSTEAQNASRPLVAADGERLIAVWSEYEASVGLQTAVAIMWAWRPVSDPLGWSTPQLLFDRGRDLIGGRFLDLASIPTGGVGLVYGRRSHQDNQLYVQQLPADAVVWDPPVLLAAGNLGSYPRIAFASDGTLYAVYNLGSGELVDVGGFAVAPGLSAYGIGVNLTGEEAGIQGIASVSVDANDAPWVIYFHQPRLEPVVEARVLATAPL